MQVAVDNTLSVLVGRDHAINATAQCRGNLVALLKLRDRYIPARGGGRGNNATDPGFSGVISFLLKDHRRR